MNKDDIRTFLTGELGVFSSSEEKGLDLLLNSLEYFFPSFDIYTGILAGGVKSVIFGSFRKTDDGKGRNTPVFAIYAKNSYGGKYSFGMYFDDKKLRIIVNSRYETRFYLESLVGEKDRLLKYLKPLSKAEEIVKRMMGGNHLIRSNSYSDINWNEDVRITILRRSGQPKFRKKLLEAFHSKCAITRCGIEELLEAAHIIPHRQKVNYDISNGLLLRADIHTLYDLGLLVIDGYGKVSLKGELKSDSNYHKLDGIKLTMPDVSPDKLKAFKYALGKRVSQIE